MIESYNGCSDKLKGIQISCVINEYTWYQFPRYQNQYPDWKWMISDSYTDKLTALHIEKFDFLTNDDRDEKKGVLNKNNMEKIYEIYKKIESMEGSNESNDEEKKKLKDQLETNLNEMELSKNIVDMCFLKDNQFFLHVPNCATEKVVEKFDANFQFYLQLDNASKTNEKRKTFREAIIKTFSQFEMYYMDCSSDDKTQKKLKLLYSSNPGNFKERDGEFLLSVFFSCFSRGSSFLKRLKSKFWFRVFDSLNIFAFRQELFEKRKRLKTKSVVKNKD